ncbi:MAG: hypothetical protein PHO86_03065 [Bacilli bacterium]|nr:hypothetical protein [Bacilli bacterium]
MKDKKSIIFKTFLKYLYQNSLMAICSTLAMGLIIILLNIVIGFILKYSDNRETTEEIIRTIGVTVIFVIFKCVVFKDVIEKTKLDKRMNFWVFFICDALATTFSVMVVYWLANGIEVVENSFIDRVIYILTMIYRPYITPNLLINNLLLSITIGIIAVWCLEISYYWLPKFVFKYEEKNKKGEELNQKLSVEEKKEHRDKWDGYY